jgi:hypothetical protein
MKKTTVAVLTTLILLVLCFVVGHAAWGPNVEADYVGTGYLGVILPVAAVLCAFLIGRATEMYLRAEG